MWNIKLVCNLFILQYFVNVDSADYQLEFVNEKIMSKCPEKKDNFIDKLFDISDMKFDYTDDDNIRLHGPLRFIGDIPKDRPIQLIATTYKKHRGAWTNTALNLNYENLCDSIYSPHEHWYAVTSSVPEDKRSCPPEKGWEVQLDNVVSILLKNMKFRDAEGSYKAVVKMAYGKSPNEMVCFEIYFNAHNV